MTTFYVAAFGSDKQAGTLMSPWRTVGRVNQKALLPGDSVLFHGGDLFDDAQLLPQRSGISAAPVVYSSYGPGWPVIKQGVWSHANHVALRELMFGAQVQAGTNGGITVTDWEITNCVIAPAVGNETLGVNYSGNGLMLSRSTIKGTGLSGLQATGDNVVVAGCLIDNVGLYPVGYNAHGLYLDASNAVITGNMISRFSESAVSARYHNSVVVGNVFDTGQIGIDFYQTDSVAGMSRWAGNTIRNTTAAGIYVSTDGVFSLRESFTIRGNRIAASSVAGWREMNLGATSGRYVLA